MNKGIMELNEITDLMDLRDVYRVFHHVVAHSSQQPIEIFPKYTIP
jgi:hypothetical protein